MDPVQVGLGLALRGFDLEGPLHELQKELHLPLVRDGPRALRDVVAVLGGGGRGGEASAARSGGSGGRELVCRVSVELSPHLDLPPQRRGADVTVLPDDLQELPGGLCGFIEKTRQGGARGATVVSTRSVARSSVWPEAARKPQAVGRVRVVNGGLTRPVGRRRRVLSCRAVSSARPALVRPKRSESRNGRRSSARAARARRCQPRHSPEQGASQHDGSKAAIPINRESLLHCYPDSRARTESNSRFSPPTPRGSGRRNLCSIRSKPCVLCPPDCPEARRQPSLLPGGQGEKK